MGLPRPPEPFHRVYSPPEPPPAARRSLTARRGCVPGLLAAAAFVVAALVVFLLLPGDGTSQKAKPPAVPSPSETESQEPSPTEEEPTSRPTPTPTERVFATLPEPCGTVPASTVRRLVPQARVTKSSNRTFANCAYLSPGEGVQGLQIETRLYATANTPRPVEDAHRSFGVQWTQASKATEERTLSLRRQSGLGDEAYHWFKVDRRIPVVIGMVTARLGNVVITVSYSEQTGSKNKAEAQQQRCLSEATGVAREVLADLR